MPRVCFHVNLEPETDKEPITEIKKSILGHCVDEQF